MYTLKNLRDVGNPFAAMDKDGNLLKVPYGTKVMVLHDLKRETTEYLAIPDESVMEKQYGATSLP